MRILFTNISMGNPGGSETFTYTMANELIKHGHELQIFSRKKGFMFNKIQELGVTEMDKDSYDLILANHRHCIEVVHGKGPMIQTCHGYIPKPEQPHELADYHVSISQEVFDHLQGLGFESTIIHNGIDCERFRPIKPVNQKLTNVLSLVQNDGTNEMLAKLCKIRGLNFEGFNKKTNYVWEVEEKINEADLVISLGRGAYEAFACGRQVLIFDNRSYLKPYGDGMVTGDNVEELIKNNCSGRRYKNLFTEDDLLAEFDKYDPAEGEKLRQFALENLNVAKNVKRYVKLREKIK